jgi:hypothetical protein
MKNAVTRALVIVAVLAGLAAPVSARPHPTPTPAPTPTPVADPAITRIARQQFLAWQIGNVNKSLYSPGVVAKMTDAKIAQTSQAIRGLGALLETVYIGPFSASDLPADAHGYIYQMKCTEGAVYQWMIVDGQGKIATIFFKDKLDVETIEGSSVPPPPPLRH